MMALSLYCGPLNENSEGRNNMGKSIYECVCEVASTVMDINHHTTVGDTLPTGVHRMACFTYLWVVYNMYSMQGRQAFYRIQ